MSNSPRSPNNVSFNWKFLQTLMSTFCVRHFFAVVKLIVATTVDYLASGHPNHLGSSIAEQWAFQPYLHSEKTFNYFWQPCLTFSLPVCAHSCPLVLSLTRLSIFLSFRDQQGNKHQLRFRILFAAASHFSLLPLKILHQRLEMKKRDWKDSPV